MHLCHVRASSVEPHSMQPIAAPGSLPVHGAHCIQQHWDLATCSFCCAAMPDGAEYCVTEGENTEKVMQEWGWVTRRHRAPEVAAMASSRLH